MGIAVSEDKVKPRQKSTAQEWDYAYLLLPSLISK